MNPLDIPSISPDLIAGLPLVNLAIAEIRDQDEPSVGPQWIDKRLSGGHGAKTMQDNGGNGRPPTLGEMLTRWGHLSVTVTLIIFLWGQYESAQAWRREAERTMVINTDRIMELRKANEVQDAALLTIITDMNRRLDVQREDIRELQRQLNAHFQRDEQRYQQRPR